jgi:serine/threonine protein kinase
MNRAERWQQVSRIYSAALAREETARAAYLQDACAADEALRREVESLLAGVAVERDALRPQHSAEAAAEDPSAPDFSAGIGSRIGVYEIRELLGAGGMGEVYRGHDTTLGRDVAIKVLPLVFLQDRERRARFDREARLLAALNHPNIGAIYGVEVTPDGGRALILELVEGSTLADRLRKGALPLTDALPLARQIADALHAAHERGIVHRDLKPANISLTRDGRVKVLDFGLARVGGRDGDASDEIAEERRSLPTARTKSGVILGTAAYMSPEQARGQPLDKRTDIWAFGCVMYEMLTGQQMFARDTVTDTLAAIVDGVPDWQALPAATPANVRRLLRRCLEKDPKRRLRDFGDVRIELDDDGGTTTDGPSMPSLPF